MKRNSAGTLFLKIDLLERKKAIQNLGSEIKYPKQQTKLDLDLPTIREAINYFTIQSLYKGSDKRTEPIFARLSQKIDVTAPFNEIADELAHLLEFEKDLLKESYFKSSSLGEFHP